MSTTKTLRVGVIGAGEHMTRGHLHHLVRDPRVHLVAWSDPNGDAKGRKVLERAGAVRLNGDDIFHHPDIDMLFVGSPDRFHRDHMRGAVARGKHVMCEKPVGVHASEMGDVGSTLGLATAGNLLVTTCHPRRFDPPIVALKRMLENPAKGGKHHPSLNRLIGELLRFEFSFWYHVASKEDLHASLMSDHFNHEVDLFAHLLGPRVDRIEARRLFDGPDRYAVTGAALGERPVEFDFRGFRTLAAKRYDEVIRLVGDRGAVTFSLNTGIMVNERTSVMIGLASKNYDVMFRDLNANVVSAALGEAPSYIDGARILRNNDLTARLLDFGELKPA